MLKPFRWRGVSALSWVPDKRTSLEFGHVPRLALPQHTGLCVVVRWTSSGVLSMFHNTFVFARPCRKNAVSNLFLPRRSVNGFGPASLASKMQDSQRHCSLGDGVSSVPRSSADMMSSGGKVPYGFALSAAPESASALYDAWKCNTVYFERLLFGEAGQL